MFFTTIILLLLQGIIGFSYIIIEDNGYYSSLRPQLLRSPIDQWSWPNLMTPMVIPVNVNPFSWLQSQSQNQQEVDFIRDRQNLIFSLLKCMIIEDTKDRCKMMVEKSRKLFSENDILEQSSKLKPVIEVKHGAFEKPAMHIESASLGVKPLEIINLGVDSSATQQKLSDFKPLENKVSKNKEEAIKSANKTDSVNISVQSEKVDIIESVTMESKIEGNKLQLNNKMVDLNKDEVTTTMMPPTTMIQEFITSKELFQMEKKKLE